MQQRTRPHNHPGGTLLTGSNPSCSATRPVSRDVYGSPAAWRLENAYAA